MKSRVTEHTPRGEATKVNLARFSMYAFLSRAFRMEVDEHFLGTIAATQPTIELLSESHQSEEFKEGNRLLREFLQRVKGLESQDRKCLITDLAVEYAALFLTGGANKVPLAESVYVGKDHLLYETPYHEVLGAYRSLGFEKDKDFTEPEDHVSVELEFMANMCAWVSKTLDRGDIEKAIAYLNLQDEFFRDHLMRWVPDLCHKLKGIATQSFYIAVADLTDGFITLDSEVPRHLTEVLKNSISVTK